jgi:hypothetical protein
MQDDPRRVSNNNNDNDDNDLAVVGRSLAG